MRIKLIGNLSVTAKDGHPVTISGAKTQGLIAFLAANLGMSPTRDRIMSMFWGDRFTDQARQSLRQAVSKLRRMGLDFEEDIILSDDDRVGLNPDTVQVDLEEFFDLADNPTPEQAQRALALMNGPLLDGIYGQQADFEDWLVTERQRVVSSASKMFEQVADFQVQKGNLDKALEISRKLISLDPLRDGSQLLGIRILAQAGERAAAIKQFNSYEALLQKELGVGAGPDLESLIREIRSEKFSAVEDKVGTAAKPKPSPAPAPERQEGLGATSVAVVPFASMAPDQEVDFVASSLTSDVVMHLSKFKWLEVHANIEIDGRYLTGATLQDINKKFNLDYLVHGTLRSLGTKHRLTVQLVEPKTGRNHWVQRYDREAESILFLPDELAETIAAAAEDQIERLVGRASEDVPFEQMTAWQCYHRGLATQYEFSAETNVDAQKHFRRAIALDPNFASAYARLSYAMVISAIYFDATEISDLLDEALDLARTAARLDPDDATARFALGRVYLARGNYARSIAELGSAIELNPVMAQAHCGLGDSLAYSGDLDVAMECFEEAVRISPKDPYRWAFLGYGATALLFKKDFEGALDWATRSAAVPNSHYWATALRVSALGHLGRDDEAKTALAELEELKPGLSCDYVRERLFYLRDPEQINLYVGGLRKAGLA